mmetsp:Transcript_4305/g.8965  ORF Transcript_4305/g.8965 Transcript_4305/m.8965 type:complete len:225 (+) Transcript_4305:1604-2278(+)
MVRIFIAVTYHIGKECPNGILRNGKGWANFSRECLLGSCHTLEGHQKDCPSHLKETIEGSNILLAHLGLNGNNRGTVVNGLKRPDGGLEFFRWFQQIKIVSLPQGNTITHESFKGNFRGSGNAILGNLQIRMLVDKLFEGDANPLQTHNLYRTGGRKRCCEIGHIDGFSTQRNKYFCLGIAGLPILSGQQGGCVIQEHWVDFLQVKADPLVCPAIGPWLEGFPG